VKPVVIERQTANEQNPSTLAKGSSFATWRDSSYWDEESDDDDSEDEHPGSYLDGDSDWEVHAVMDDPSMEALTESFAQWKTFSSSKPSRRLLEVMSTEVGTEESATPETSQRLGADDIDMPDVENDPVDTVSAHHDARSTTVTVVDLIMEDVLGVTDVEMDDVRPSQHDTFSANTAATTSSSTVELEMEDVSSGAEGVASHDAFQQHGDTPSTPPAPPPLPSHGDTPMQVESMGVEDIDMTSSIDASPDTSSAPLQPQRRILQPKSRRREPEGFQELMAFFRAAPAAPALGTSSNSIAAPVPPVSLTPPTNEATSGATSSLTSTTPQIIPGLPLVNTDPSTPARKILPATGPRTRGFYSSPSPAISAALGTSSSTFPAAPPSAPEFLRTGKRTRSGAFVVPATSVGTSSARPDATSFPAFDTPLRIESSPGAEGRSGPFPPTTLIPAGAVRDLKLGGWLVPVTPGSSGPLGTAVMEEETDCGSALSAYQLANPDAIRRTPLEDNDVSHSGSKVGHFEVAWQEECGNTRLGASAW